MQKDNKTNNIPYIAIKFANIIFLLGILASALIIIYAIYKIYNPPEFVTQTFYIFCILFSVVFFILFSVGLKKFNNNFKVNFSIFIFTGFISVLGMETYLQLTYKPHQIENFNKSQLERENIAKAMNIDYDSRTYLEVLNDMMASGLEIFPNIYPSRFIQTDGLNSKKGRIYPFGTISNSNTLLPNELGYYPIIETDEFGFNNPKGLYNKNNVDILLTGDSFTEGFSVDSNETIGAVLREYNFNAISIGKGGNGALIKFAALREYAKPLEPKIVLWLYFNNDLEELRIESNSSILRRYLEVKNFKQNLFLRQEEIDNVLLNDIKIEWAKQNKNKVKKNKLNIINLIKLTSLRKMINLKPATSHIKAFNEILLKSKKEISSWDGKMYLVYLPSYYRYSKNKMSSNRKFVLETASNLNIPIIDIVKPFNAHKEPLSLFPFKIHGHYNPEGYRIVAETIAKRLEKDGFFQ